MAGTKELREVARGAEAVLYKTRFSGQDTLLKERIRKGYRIPQLDEKIRSQRTRREESLLSKAKRAGVNAPMVLASDGTSITMEWIEGERVKDVLNEMGQKERAKVCGLIGEVLGRLHSAGIVHGDVTTSNMILKEGRLFVIDFGLGKPSGRTEDHATDLFVLLEALKAAHFKIVEDAWKTIIKAYKYNNANADHVLRRLQDIEKRRRYRTHA